MSTRRWKEPATTLLSGGAAQKLLWLSPELACVINSAGDVLQYNAMWEGAVGGAGEAGAPIHFADFVHSEDRRRTLRKLAALARGSVATVTLENRVRTLDGTYRWLRWRLTSDTVAGLVYALGEDFTVHKANERALVDAAEGREHVFDQLSEAMAVTDEKARFTYVSPSCERLLGYTSHELVGRSAVTFIHPQDRALAHLTTATGADLAEPRTVSLRYRHKDGSYAWIEVRSRAIVDSGTGQLSETQALMRDIGERKAAQVEIERQAFTDALTGLANRVLLADRMQQGLKRLKRSPGFLGVLMLDLDHFKLINDTLGHQVGDAVLQSTAQRLQRLARPDDTVARFGGDEFAVVVQGLTDPADLAGFASRVVAALREPYRVGQEEVVTTVSVGIATSSRPDYLPDSLLREADLALYRAKDRGRDRHEVFGEDLQVRALERLETERLLRHAVAEKKLRVEYQPIVDIATGAVVEAEALVRLDDTVNGRFPPEQFILVAEEAGLMAEIDAWVRKAAMSQLAEWHSTRPALRLQRIAINVTARDLASPAFVARVASDLQRAGLEGTDLALEVTEHTLMQTSHSALSALAELRTIGVHIGLDDFGTGFSALSYLQAFPLDFLKIDRSFVERIATDSGSAAITSAVIELAHALGLMAVAEGVETPEQLAMLRSFGCERAQGFLFSAALPAAGLAGLLGGG